MKTATMVSMEISIGSVAIAGGVCEVMVEEEAAALVERSAECSWAE